MPAFLVGAVVALSWVTTSYTLAVNNSATAASASGCSFPKYDNETGRQKWDCDQVWKTGQLAECYDDLTFVYGFLATRFAARVTTFAVAADKFGVYQRLAEGTVVLAKDAVNSAFLDNCQGQASIGACRAMLQQCDVEGNAEVFDIAKEGATKMCEVLKWTGVAGLAAALKNLKMEPGLGVFEGVEAFDECGEGADMQKVAEQMAVADASNSEMNVWNTLTVSAHNPGVAVSCYYGILYSFQAYMLRERTCRLYRGLFDAKLIGKGEAGRCLHEDRFDSFAMISAMDGNDLGSSYYGLDDYLDSRPPAINPKYVPYKAPDSWEKIPAKEHVTVGAKAAKKKKEDEETKMMHGRTCGQDFLKKDEVLLGCLSGIEKLFATLAIKKGADSAVSYFMKDAGWVDVVQAVAGLAGVRHIVGFLKTSFFGRAFDLGKCMKRIVTCGENHQVAAVNSVHALLKGIQKGPFQGGTIPLVVSVCASFVEKGENKYLAKVLKLAACATRTHREAITVFSCHEGLTALLGPIWDSGDSPGPLKSIRELLAVEKASESDDEDNENANASAEINDKLEPISGALENALSPLVDATDALVTAAIGVVAAFMHRKLSVSIDELSKKHSLKVKAEELFKDDLEFATMSMWGM